MLSNFLILSLVIITIWLVVITVVFWRMLSHYNKLTEGLTDQSFKSVLDNLMKNLKVNKKELDTLKEYYDKMQKEGQFHIQKVGLLRFNPFKDTGGDQSFILTLTDASDTGVVISGLYSRSGTRWYTKKVVNGKGSEHELSDEEKKALKDASDKHLKLRA
jgi:hypothetical protein